MTPKLMATKKGSRSKAPTVDRKDAPKTTGRLPAEVNEKVIEGMALAGSSDKEIAAFNLISVDTLTRRFAEILAKGRAQRKWRLRSWQMKAAEKGNAAMLIWLGKVELGQSETIRHANPDGTPIVPSRVTIKVVRPGGKRGA